MAAKSLSEIDQAVADITPADRLVGVVAGATDALFSPDQFGGLPKKSADTNLYVDKTGSDSNPGTQLLPFLTVQRAIIVASSFNWVSLFNVTINVGPGTYDDGQITLGPLVGAVANNKLKGDSNNPQNVVLKHQNDILVNVYDSGWILDGFTYDTNQSAIMIGQSSGGQGFATVLMQNHHSFTDSLNSGLLVCFDMGNFAGMVNNQNGNFVLNFPSSFQNVFSMQNFCQVNFDFATFNFPNPCTISKFANTFQNCLIEILFPSYVNGGTVTGSKGNYTISSDLFTNGGVFSDVPGSTNPTFDPTSQLIGGVSGFGQRFFQSKAGIVTTSDVMPGAWNLFKDTTGGSVYIAANDGGTIKTVTLV